MENEYVKHHWSFWEDDDFIILTSQKIAKSLA